MKSLIFLGLAAAQRPVLFGKCPEVPVFPDFDLSKYTGTWYEAGSYPTSFSNPEGRCTKAIYKLTSSQSVSVNNSQVATQPSGIVRRTVALGQAERVDMNIENGLRVTFNFRNPIAAFFNQLLTPQRPNYYVWETDYTRYAVVGNCEESFFKSSTFAYILIRDLEWTQTADYRNFRDQIAEKYNLDLSIWIENEVKNGIDCDYQELYYQ